jgi:hypothetical protein
VLEQERKWMVENHEGNQEIVLDKTDSRQTVYIYNCHKSVIQVGWGLDDLRRDVVVHRGWQHSYTDNRAVPVCSINTQGKMQVSNGL